jgi:hypothetical protein
MLFDGAENTLLLVNVHLDEIAPKVLSLYGSVQ